MITIIYLVNFYNKHTLFIYCIIYIQKSVTLDAKVILERCEHANTLLQSI